ncbi:MAG: hypothetical protein PHO46_11390, partial [Thermoguttaceae bacterium]|nr:hypothetical protein [Thermoguttaceae bacterium]
TGCTGGLFSKNLTDSLIFTFFLQKFPPENRRGSRMGFLEPPLYFLFRSAFSEIFHFIFASTGEKVQLAREIASRNN